MNFVDKYSVLAVHGVLRHTPKIFRHFASAQTGKKNGWEFLSDDALCLCLFLAEQFTGDLLSVTYTIIENIITDLDLIYYSTHRYAQLLRRGMKFQSSNLTNKDCA